MKITKKQLQHVVRNVINEQRNFYGSMFSHKNTAPIKRYDDDNKLIGSIGAIIGYDDRYRQNLSVYYHPSDDTVSVELKSTGAVSGRDGPGTATPWAVEGLVRTDPNPSAKEVVGHVRAMIAQLGDTIARYGKPSKKFLWGQPHGAGGQYGLSVRAAQYALDWARRA